MSDQPEIPEFLDEDDRRYYEQLQAMSPEDLLDQTRQTRDELRADGGKLAQKLGLTDEYLDELDSSIAKMEQAIKDEQIANARLAEASRAMNNAADRYQAA